MTKVDEVALRVAKEMRSSLPPEPYIFDSAAVEFWTTNDGDSWYEHPADAELLHDVLGNDPKVGDEFEVTAGWLSVSARYRIASQDGEDFEVECVSHPNDTKPTRPAMPDQSEIEQRVAEAVWKMVTEGGTYEEMLEGKWREYR
jgi:hypothetical protein